MPQYPPLKKLEIWLNDNNAVNYDYAFTGKGIEKTESMTALKGLNTFLAHRNLQDDLQIDMVGGESSRPVDFYDEVVKKGTSAAVKNGKKLNFRLITSGILSKELEDFTAKNNVSLRSSISPMEPTDIWWYGQNSDNRPESSSVKTVKERFGSFQHRVRISQQQPEIMNRIESLAVEKMESILLTVNLHNNFKKSDEDDLIESLDSFSSWVLKSLLDGVIPPVVNVKQALFLWHQKNSGNPYPLKNRCNNTNERILLDSEGIFRTCRHYPEYSTWKLGDAESGISESRRMNLHRYGIVVRDGCRNCTAVDFCAGPCISAASVYAESYFRPMGYFCLFTTLLFDTIGKIYTFILKKHPNLPDDIIRQIGNPMELN
jgi:radical SAM protein with 4Fe4S-binding SPASM domain